MCTHTFGYNCILNELNTSGAWVEKWLKNGKNLKTKIKFGRYLQFFVLD